MLTRESDALPHSRNCSNPILKRDGKRDICGCAHVMLTRQLSFYLSDKSADALADRRGSAGTGEAGGGVATVHALTAETDV